MKLKMILFAIAIAIIAFVGIGLYQSSSLKTIQIVKVTTINVSKEKVFDMVKFLKNFPKWSPFLAQDPTQKYEVKGIDGTVGARYHWNGNNGKDVGFQEIKAIQEGKFIGVQCDIQKPFKAQPTFEYYFTETTNGVEVKQDFKVASGAVDAFFMWLSGARAEMEKTNQQGLDLLKAACEKE